MPLARTLVILSGLEDAGAARRTVMAAYNQAQSPVGLRFALPELFRAALTQETEDNEELPSDALVFYSGEGLAVLRRCGDTYFLALQGEHDFSAMWDREIQSRFNKVEYNALLTGCMGAACEQLEPQAYLPAFGAQEGNRVQITRGLPLVCSATPVRTMVVDPALVFGRPQSVAELDPERELLSLAAHIANVPVYALDRPVLWPVKQLPTRWFLRPQGELLRFSSVQRFEQLAGLGSGAETLSLRYRWGLYGASETYAQKLPGALAVRGRIRSFIQKMDRPVVPHLISAFVDLPNPSKPYDVYMLRFTYLNALQNLPLALYTGGNWERHLRALCRNARSYPERSVLPRHYMARKMTPKDHLGRSKWLLMRKTAAENPSFTHVAWINMDILHHPICPDVLPDFSPLMDDRIHLAVVNGKPDPSFIVAPSHRLGLISRECESMSQFDVELGRSTTEEALIQRLYDRYSDLFTLHPMPRKHLLFHWALDRRLVDAHYRALLALAGNVQRTDSIRIRMDGKEVEL